MHGDLRLVARRVRLPPDGQVNHAGVLLQGALGDREVLLDDLRPLEDQRRGAVVPAHLVGDEHAARLAVYAVRQPRDDVLLRVVQVPVTQVERVDERVVAVAAGRMDDEVRRLVEDDEQVVLVEDLQRDLGDAVRGLRRRRERQADFLAELDAVRAIEADSAGGDLALGDQFLHLRPRAPVQAHLQELVEAHPGLVGVDVEDLRLLRHDQLVGRLAEGAARPLAALGRMLRAGLSGVERAALGFQGGVVRRGLSHGDGAYRRAAPASR